MASHESQAQDLEQIMPLLVHGIEIVTCPLLTLRDMVKFSSVSLAYPFSHSVSLLDFECPARQGCTNYS